MSLLLSTLLHLLLTLSSPWCLAPASAFADVAGIGGPVRSHLLCCWQQQRSSWRTPHLVAHLAASAGDTPSSHESPGAAAAAGRDMSSLKQWAKVSGVRLGGGIALERDEGAAAGDWGVKVTGRRGAKAGDTVLTVPANLILSSADIPNSLLDPDRMSKAVDILQSNGMNEYRPNFILVVRLLEELAKGPSGRWHAWFRSLPTEFGTGVYMDEAERSSASTFASEFLDFQERQLEAIELAARSAFGSPREGAAAGVESSIEALLSREKDSVRWAYSVVFTRSWRSKSRGDVATIVPVGDMFNHCHPANVAVEECADDYSIGIVLKDDADRNAPLYLSYGIAHLPARFLVTFGFVDESCPSIFANITFANTTAEAAAADEMGFADWAKMTFRVKDGAVADAVWDAVLYKVIGSDDCEGRSSSSEAQRELYSALAKNDGKIISEMYSKYDPNGLKVRRWLRNHVEQMLTSTYPKDLALKLSDHDFEQHPRLEMIVRYNAWMRTVLQRVKANL